MRDLSGFTGAGYEKGRSAVWQLAWMFASGVIVMRWWCPNRLRIAILRGFGAEIAEGVLIRHRVRVHWPWKLSVGEHSWIGEGAWILNLEDVRIGQQVCISQEVLLCTGSHDRRSPTFEFDNAPIVIRDGAWIATRATVLRGTTIGRNALVGASALVVASVPDEAVVMAPAGTVRSPRKEG